MKQLKNIVWVICSLSMLTACNEVLGTNSGNALKTTSGTSSNAIIFASDEPKIEDLRDDLDSLMCGGYDLDHEVCTKNKEFFAKKIGFNVDDIGKSLSISSVRFLSLKYDSHIEFPKQNLKTVTSGLVIIPKIGKDYISYNKVKGIVLYFHPTAFDKSSVPSMNYYENRTKQDTLYAALYAAQGYIVVAPDYIGQGVDYKNIHPYVLYPKENVENAVQLLNAALPVIKDFIKMPDNAYGLNVMSVGYSEGAGYSSFWYECTVGGSECFPVDKAYHTVASVGIDGAYDLKDTVYPFLTESVSGNGDKNKFNVQSVGLTDLAKPGLSMLAMMGYMHYDLGYNTSTEYIKGFNENFYKMKCTYPLKESSCYINGTSKDFLAALQEPQVKDTDFLQAIFYSAMEKMLTRNGQNYTYPVVGGNSVYSLIQSGLIDSESFKLKMNISNIQEHVAAKPILFMSLNKDSMVSPNNTDTAYEIRSRNIIHGDDFTIPVSILKINNDLVAVKPISGETSTALDHIQGENFLNIIALDYLEKCAGKFYCLYRFGESPIVVR